MRSLLAAALAVALLVPATAAAQSAGQSAPPDEAANARAFAAAAAQLEGDTADLRLDKVLDPPCPGIRHLPERAQDGAGPLLAVAIVGGFYRAVAPDLTRFSMALHAVPTADPALRSGRTAWRHIRRFYARMAEEPRFCGALRRFIRAGYRPTPAVRSARRLVVEADRLVRRADPALRRAVRRMRALGVPRADARRFRDPAIGATED